MVLKSLLKIIQTQRKQQEQLDYLVEALELLVQIETHKIKK